MQLELPGAPPPVADALRRGGARVLLAPAAAAARPIRARRPDRRDDALLRRAEPHPGRPSRSSASRGFSPTASRSPPSSASTRSRAPRPPARSPPATSRRTTTPVGPRARVLAAGEIPTDVVPGPRFSLDARVDEAVRPGTSPRRSAATSRTRRTTVARGSAATLSIDMMHRLTTLTVGGGSTTTGSPRSGGTPTGSPTDRSVHRRRRTRKRVTARSSASRAS